MMARFGAKPDLFKVFNPNKGGGNALTASGFRIKKAEADTMRRLIQPWQQRSFIYYDIVPEIKYAAQFYSRALSVLRLFPAVKDDQDEMEETDDPVAVEQLQRIQDPGGGTSGLLASYGRLMFLTGEAYLLVSQNHETGLEQWEMLSTDELRVTGSQYIRYRAPSLQVMNYGPADDEDYAPVEDDQAVAYRIWKRHPRYSYLADSTMQGVLDVCEEIVLLTQVVRARARSRMAGPGILLVNGKVIPVPSEAVPDEDSDEDPFMRELTSAMTSPIVDEGSASAVVPIVVRVDVEDVDKVMKHIQIIDPTQIYPETGLRYELIKRLAIGLDMPPEILLGVGENANHWTAWQIDEQTWKSHLQPVAQQFVDDLNSSFYQPTLREMGVGNWQDYFIAYDAAAVINHPDRSKDANDLFDRNAIGKKALREAKNFSDVDAPTEEESNENIGIKLRDGSYVKYGIPSVKAGGIEPFAGELEKAADTGAPTGPPGPQGQGGASGQKGPPPAPGEPGSEQQQAVAASGNGHATEAFVSRVLGAADLALYRARELAGNRVRNYAKRDRVILQQLEGVKARDVAPTLGRDKVRELGAPDERELVAGAREFMVDALRVWGIAEPFLETLGERIEQHAAKTLFDQHPQPLPQSFSNYVAGIKEASG